MKKHRSIKSHLAEWMYNHIASRLPSSLARWGGKHYKALRANLARVYIAKCGKNVNIEPHASFNHALCIDDNSGIGEHSEIYGDVRIGKDVMMGTNCIIYSRNHAFDRIDIPMRAQGFSQVKPVVIEDDVWIGGRVTILPGVRVGTGAVIGAGAVVTKNVPPYAVMGGNPAKVLRYRKDNCGEKENPCS